ncbi:hypothetical protein AAFF_G00414340 [Aldrovandia affinis]|uniref:3'-5' exonuclease domain-containing protein n=1 Tax=Aldrovandia affinis TaxID=143900 RepID=A0AAD7SAN8_9TELE|nr:hypothetical protein AAFF_G00414340 [Aldrovandia affinis]
MPFCTKIIIKTSTNKQGSNCIFEKIQEATMDDYQFLESFKKKRIQLTLKTATYAGIVQRINLNKTVLLGEVVDVKNGRKFPGVKLFFGHEILNVEFPNTPKREHGVKDDYDFRTEGPLTVAEFQPYRKSIKLDENENEDDVKYVDFVVIDEFHEKFGPAVMHIRKQQVIGIGADGVGVSQHERLCWLQIAFKTKVYLFDILLLGARAFKNGLSMILESSHILKVTHDCRGIARCLWTQYGVNLSNVFDTQVADVMHFHAETGGFLPDRVSTLQEVVGLHLKMSPTFLASLQIKSQLTKEDRDVWYVRPCPVSLLKVMALSVIHLQSLRLVLWDALMSDYMGRVDSYLDLSREEPVSTQHIGTSSGLELPAELRALESLTQKRQEWAVGRFPATEDGLLVRSSPRPTPPTRALGEDGPLQQSNDVVPWGEADAEQAEETTSSIRPRASAQGPGDVTGRDLPSLLCTRPAGSPEVTQPPGQAASGEAPVSVAGGPREAEIAAAEGAAGGAIGRGRQLQMEGVPTPATCPPAGRGLCLQIPPHVSRELPGAATRPQRAGQAADASQGPAPPPPEGTVAWTGGAGGAPPQGSVLTGGAAPTGTMPENIISLGRGLFFHRPSRLASQFNPSLSSLE